MTALARKDRTTAHTALVSEIRLALGMERDLVLWLNAVKHVEIATNSGLIHMSTGLVKGSSDLVGILRPRGRWFCLEAKTGKAKPQPNQVQWLQLVRDMGGFAAVVHSVEEAWMALARARLGEAA